MVPGEKTAHSYQTVLNGANDRRTQARMSGAAPIWATATPSTFASRLQNHICFASPRRHSRRGCCSPRAIRPRQPARTMPVPPGKESCANRGAIALLLAKPASDAGRRAPVTLPRPRLRALQGMHWGPGDDRVALDGGARGRGARCWSSAAGQADGDVAEQAMAVDRDGPGTRVLGYRRDLVGEVAS